MDHQPRSVDSASRTVVARNIVMEYDRKTSDITKLLRSFVKQLDRHRTMMLRGGYEDTTYLSELIDVETALNDMMRKLG